MRGARGWMLAWALCSQGALLVQQGHCANLAAQRVATSSSLSPDVSPRASGISMSRIEPATHLDELFHSAGVMSLVAGMNTVAQDELEHLSASGLFSPADIERVKRLMGILREDALYLRLQEAVQTRFKPSQLDELYAWSRHPAVQMLLSRERALLKAPELEQLKLYRVRMKASVPSRERVALMRALDVARSQTQLEGELKTSMRKVLLTTVSLVKTHKAPGDSALDRELDGYRQQLQSDIADRAAETYLYMYRQTESEQVQQIIDHYRAPLFIEFMGVCEEVVGDYFLKARQSIARNSGK